MELDEVRCAPRRMSRLSSILLLCLCLLAGLSRREQEDLLKLLAKVKAHTVEVLS